MRVLIICIQIGQVIKANVYCSDSLALVPSKYEIYAIFIAVEYK